MVTDFLNCPKGTLLSIDAAKCGSCPLFILLYSKRKENDQESLLELKTLVEKLQSNVWLLGDFYILKFDELSKIVSEYDQEIPQPQTADNPMVPRGRATQPSRDTRKTN